MKKNLNKYLHKIDEECEKKYNYLLTKMMQEEGINEELKIQNQLEWVGRINNLKNRINEIILREFIYN